MLPERSRPGGGHLVDAFRKRRTRAGVGRFRGLGSRRARAREDRDDASQAGDDEFLALTLLAGMAVAAADVFQQYGLDRQAWGDAFVSSLTQGALYAPSVSAKLKGVPAAQRASVVNALGAAAKAFFGSAEFRARRAKEYEASISPPLAVLRRGWARLVPVLAGETRRSPAGA